MSKLLYDTRFLYRGTRHFLFLGFTVLLFSSILAAQSNFTGFHQTLGITSINAFFFFSYAYITIFLLIPEFLLKAKVSWFVLLFLLVGFGLSALKLVCSDYIFYSFIAPENIEKTGIMNLKFIVVNTKDMTFIVALFCIGKYAKDYVLADTIRKKLEIQNATAKSKLLQSQFDPHFMFNTINNMYALSLLDPQKTKDVILRMKTVLNYIIDESKKDFVKLSKEIKLVKNYIQLEKLRYGKRLQVDYQILENRKGLRIPPLILFVLVENCFKHGSSLDAGTPWIKIDVGVESGKIILATENSKPQTIPPPQQEIESDRGLKSLKKRLDIIYKPEGYKLTIQSMEHSFSVELELKEDIEYRQKTYR